MSENVGYGPTLPLAGGTLTGALTINSAGGATLVDIAANVMGLQSSNSDQKFRVYGANGAYWERGANSEILTISTSAFTDTAGSLLPANSVIEGVTVRVIAAIPTAATFTIGDANVAARFATGVSVAVTTAAVGITQMGSTGIANTLAAEAAAAKVRITPSLSPATSTGQLRLTVFYSSFTPATS